MITTYIFYIDFGPFEKATYVTMHCIRPLASLEVTDGLDSLFQPLGSLELIDGPDSV